FVHYCCCFVTRCLPGSPLFPYTTLFRSYGPDLFVMDAKAREIVSVMRPIHGVTDLDYDHFVGLPQLQIIIDRAATARYGINIQDVQDGIEAATKGRVVTQVFEGERRFDLAVRL